jgi:hypothetical protein
VVQNELAHLRVVLAEDAHHLFGLRGLREGGKASQVEEDDGDLPPMRLERIVRAPRHDELGELGREETLEASELLELAHLLLHAPFEGPVPLGALLGEALQGVMEVLDPEHRLDPSHEGRLIHRLGEVLVAAGLEARHDVLGIRLGRDEDDRREGQRCVRTEAPANLESVHLRHHDVQEDQVRLHLLSGSERGLAVGGGHDVVSVGGEARLQDMYVGGRIVHDQDTRWSSHGEVSRNPRTLARSSRGTKGLVT